MNRVIKKNVLITFSFLIFFCCILYLLFFISRIIKISTSQTDSKDQSAEKYIIVGGEYDYVDILQAFYDDIQNLALSQNIKIDLLMPESLADTKNFNNWIDYSRFVRADGLILFCNNENFVCGEVIDSEERKIPVVISGIASVDNNYMVSLCRGVIKENASWSKGILFSRKGINPQKTNYLYQSLQSDINLYNYCLDIDDYREDEVRLAFVEAVKNDDVDVIFCMAPEDVNFASQTIIDLNLVGKVDLVGLFGDSKTKEYVDKGIVYRTFDLNIEQMAYNALTDLLYLIDGNTGVTK